MIVVLFSGLVALGWVHVWHAMVFNFVMGCGFTMNMPVRQSLVANTVPLDDLGNAIALNAMANNASRIFGPAIGGVLLVAFGAAINFLLQACLFLCMVMVILPMKVPYRDTTSASNASVLSNMKEGVQYVLGNQTIFGLLILSFIPALFVMSVIQILPAFTDHVLHAKADIYGYLMTSFGVGGLLATLTMALFGSIIRSGWLGIGALSCASFVVILFSQTSLLWFAFLMLFMLGFCMMTFRVNNNTLVQTLAQDELRGRVMSLYHMDLALVPLGSSILGACADIFSIPAAVAVSGMLGLALTLVLMASVKQMRALRHISV